MSPKDTLSRNDIQNWLRNTIIFSSPAMLAFLMGLQAHNMQFALGAGYSALLASLIDLFRKYSAGTEYTSTPLEVKKDGS